MNLTDPEVLELHDLCSAVVDGTLNDAQRTRLMQWLASSEEARRDYVRALALSASLHDYAGEMQSDAPDAPDAMAEEKILRPSIWWTIGSLAAAAAVALLLTVIWPKPTPQVAAVQADAFVARLTGSREAQWADGTTAVAPGTHLRNGQRLELARGFAEITFDSGAQVVLEGPASLDVGSAWDATLRRGALRASVPPQAIGFRISNPAVEVVDLGTEFTMIADANGSAEVLVLKGAVEAAPRESTGQPVVLREKQARRFAASGVTAVSDTEQKFARFTQSPRLDRFMQATNYVHWSFDEPDGRQLGADAFGLPLAPFDAQLESVPEAGLSALRTEGRWQNALRFDGKLFAKAAFPGISANTPRTVAFWVKVPEDAPLSDAYAMVAWRANSRQLGSRPVHIDWNRNPVEGPLGALRTDFGGGYAVGTTPLRDGRWHHVALVFVPDADADTLLQVKQYVDGRLEGSAMKPATRRAPTSELTEERITAASDVLWLGCRLGSDRQRRERFRGELDELFITDRPLTPQEIVQLMQGNNLDPSPALVLAVRSPNPNNP